VLVAIAVAEDGFREVIGVVEGAKEDKESSVEEALMEMYLAGVSARRVEDITED